MSALRHWLTAREPAPPAPLAAALDATIGATSGAQAAAGVAGAGSLAELGRERLERALERLGRERASAYALLEADALFTYACEAALETDDPPGTLRRILTVAGR